MSSEPTAPSGRSASTDRLFAMLRDPVRRALLIRLADRQPVEVREVTPADIDGWDGDGTTLAVALDHQHLPALAESGLVEWDRETGIVRRGPRFEPVRPILDLVEQYRLGLVEGDCG